MEPNGNAANSQSSVWEELDPATEPGLTMFQGSPIPSRLLRRCVHSQLCGCNFTTYCFLLHDSYLIENSCQKVFTGQCGELYKYRGGTQGS